MGIGADYGGFGLDRLDAADRGRVLDAFPRLQMKDRFRDACRRVVVERPDTSYDNFLRDFGERFVPGYQRLSTVEHLLNAPFDE